MNNDKISETQRKYFARRINEEFNNEIALMKQQEAKGIEELSTTNIEEYMDTIGVKNVVEQFRKKEVAFDNIKRKLNTIINNLEDTDPTDYDVKQRYNFYGNSLNVFSFKEVEKYFDMKCNQIAKHHYRKRNKVVAKLEEKRKAAVDHVYGMTKNNDVVVGLKKIFKGTNVKFLIGGSK